MSAQLTLADGRVSGADFDDARLYRYSLWRRWGPGDRTITWVMLNPSTADEHTLDPTMRKVIGFSKAWGFDGAMVVNAFAYRATNPRALRDVDDPVGPENDPVIASAMGLADTVVAAWGNHGARRADAIADIASRLGIVMHCLGTTKSGMPCHPLYRPYGAPLRPWRHLRRPGAV